MGYSGWLVRLPRTESTTLTGDFDREMAQQRRAHLRVAQDDTVMTEAGCTFFQFPYFTLDVLVAVFTVTDLLFVDFLRRDWLGTWTTGTTVADSVDRVTASRDRTGDQGTKFFAFFAVALPAAIVPNILVFIVKTVRQATRLPPGRHRRTRIDLDPRGCLQRRFAFAPANTAAPGVN